ncbi:MAG: hypothetical protein H3C35_06850 [Bacteroidetes bacterium]|nr:hypothetical protein [Bacteroidota bacterium]
MIGERLKLFAEKNFGSVAELERALGKGRNSLSQYIGDRSTPGGQLLLELLKLGCDINWLLSGDEGIKGNYLLDEIETLREENKELRSALTTVNITTAKLNLLKRGKSK